MNQPTPQLAGSTFAEWFCLAAGRRNFSIDPLRDQAYLFGQPAWQQEIDRRLERSQLLGTPVRLVWWGQYGIGKTHRLRHTEYLIKTKAYNYFPRYLVATDIAEKTGFDRLHFELTNALGKDEMRALVSSYLLKLRTNQDVPNLRDVCGGAADVENALRGFGGDNERLVAPAWRFLCGLELERTERDLANVTKNQLDSSNEFSAVIAALATIIQLEKGGQQLLYLIDEGENFTKITNRTAEYQWQECLRAILDITSLSIIMTVGAEKMDSLPPLVVKPDIVRRVQRDNYVQMEAYKIPEARSFLKGLLETWIDQTKREALEPSLPLAELGNDYDPTVYPLTQSAYDRFCQFAVVDPRTAKPSEIIARLNNVAAEAFLKNSRLITTELLTELGIA